MTKKQKKKIVKKLKDLVIDLALYSFLIYVGIDILNGIITKL